MNKKIAIFDYKIIATNPSGSCNKYILAGLCHEYEFTVFAVEFENPCPDHIHFVRIPAPTRPLALLFVTYHLMALLIYWFYRLFTGIKFDLVQISESNLSFGSISYTHFCHRAYLHQYWRQVRAKGLRGWLRWLNYWLHSLIEPYVLHKIRYIVVPSQGLKKILEDTYPFTHGKITVIPNPIDLERIQLDANFDRKSFRMLQSVMVDEIVFVFVALGNFEHKGLPLILKALKEINNYKMKLWVVGGEADVVKLWLHRVESMGLSRQVTFFGMQKDVRPFLWGADAFLFPSIYETFPLVCLEAAAAGLPLIITSLYGVDEFMKDGETGFVVDRSVESIKKGIQRFVSMTTNERTNIGQNAQKAIRRYSITSFVSNWKDFYRMKINS